MERGDELSRKKRKTLEQFILTIVQIEKEKEDREAFTGSVKIRPGVILNENFAGNSIPLSRSKKEIESNTLESNMSAGAYYKADPELIRRQAIREKLLKTARKIEDKFKENNFKSDESNLSPINLFKDLAGKNSTNLALEGDIKRREIIHSDLVEYPLLAIIPQDNSLEVNESNIAKIRLGRELFFDQSLSADGKVSCASCHDPNKGFADGKEMPIGVYREIAGTRNTPSIVNVIYRNQFFWDGRADSLEDQALEPFFHPREMGLFDKPTLMKKIKTSSINYKEMFMKAFGEEMSPENTARAIASFERTIISGNSPVDNFLNGDSDALNKSEKQGLFIYATKGKCIACHRFDHDFSMPDNSTLIDTGLFEFKEGESFKLNVPTLRNISDTAPYFHNGSIDDLEGVVELYNNGALFDRSSVSELTKRPLNLTDEEKSDLVEFLKALKGPVNFQYDI